MNGTRRWSRHPLSHGSISRRRSGLCPSWQSGKFFPPRFTPASTTRKVFELEDEMRASQVATRTCIRPSPRAPVYILLALRARPPVKDNFAAFSMGLELYNEPPYIEAPLSRRTNTGSVLIDSLTSAHRCVSAVGAGSPPRLARLAPGLREISPPPRLHPGVRSSSPGYTRLCGGVRGVEARQPWRAPRHRRLSGRLAAPRLGPGAPA